MDNSILSKRHKDCLACRIVSGCGLMGMGYYIWHHSNSRSSKIGRYSMVGIAAVAGVIGTSRLFNLYPFNNSNTSEENDIFIRNNSKN